ncbi:MAG: hypothetical protein GXN92_01995 [Candidatus Micrarchaeota archaeon]|nr:hypothetical protein [Candidatus Micrarchaeota archaeon]
MRFTEKALSFFNTLSPQEQAYVREYLFENPVKGFVTADKIVEILKTRTVIQQSEEIEAKDVSPQLEFFEHRYNSSNTRTTSSIEDFIKYFRNRFERIKILFSGFDDKYPEVEIKDLKEKQKFSLVCMVYDKLKTKNGNLSFQCEDLTGIKQFILRKDSPLFKWASEEVLKDDIIRIKGTWLGSIGIIEDIEFPDVRPQSLPTVEDDIAIMYISDTHFGSKYLAKKAIQRLLDALQGKNDLLGDLRKKIKYIMIGGDNVDGIGIYPNQEKELEEVDIEGQYKLFDAFLSEIPDYIEKIVIPGNHDAVRRAEPSEAIDPSYFTTDVHLLPNPAYVKAHGLLHLLYHGTSLDSYIASIPRLSYENPVDGAVEMLRRRHLSSIYGYNLITPLPMDFLVIDMVPHVFQTGHVHRVGVKKHRGVIVLNSGAFQEQTPYQAKQNLIPTPGEVYIFTPKQKKFFKVNFLE